MLQTRTIVAFLLGSVAGFAVAIFVQSGIEAGRASKMKRALGDAHSISIAIERYRQDHGAYPLRSADWNADLRAFLVPKYLNGIPQDSFIDKPYMIFQDHSGPVVVGLGRGGFAVRKGAVIECVPYTSEGCR